MKKVIFYTFLFFLLFYLFLSLTGCNLLLDFIDGPEANPDNTEIEGEPGPLPKKLNGADVIDSGFSTSTGQIHNGICLYHDNDSGEDFLFVTNYKDSKLSKIQISTNEIVNEFPISLTDVGPLCGIAVDPYTGDIWVCEPYNPDRDINIERYSNDDMTPNPYEIAGYPVNIILIDDIIYIADSDNNQIYNFSLSLYGDIQDLKIWNLSTEGYTFFNEYDDEYIDLSYDSENIYIVSPEIDGILVLDITTGLFIDLYLIEGKNPLKAVGIKLVNNKFYINRGSEILIVNKDTLKILRSWKLVSPEETEGYTGNYIDIEVVNGKIYVPSWIGGNFDTIGAHILVYDDPFK